MTNAVYLLFVIDLELSTLYVNVGKDVLKNSIGVLFIILNIRMYKKILVISIFIMKTTSALHTYMDYRLLVLMKNHWFRRS